METIIHKGETIIVPQSSDVARKILRNQKIKFETSFLQKSCGHDTIKNTKSENVQNEFRASLIRNYLLGELLAQ